MAQSKLLWLMALMICLTAIPLLVIYYPPFTPFSFQQQPKTSEHLHLVDNQLPFSTEELMYIKYGEGTEELVHRRDPRYLQMIRSQMAKPSARKATQIDNLSPGQHEKDVEKLLKGKRNGFFIECGANDGQFQSNTIYFEEKLNWTGLLVEANPRLVKLLLSRNRRRSYVYGGCLSPERRPTTLKFKSAGCCGGLTDHLSPSQEYLVQLYSKSESQVDLVQCYPLDDLLAAIGVNHVDYLSLDVHGAELAILKTIDFHQIRVDVLSVECYDRNETVRQRMAEEIADLFAKTRLYKKVEIGKGDLIIERLNITSTTYK